MTETKTYSGSCHCGRVAYEADADLSKAVTCNCSICKKRGALMAFVPADKFRLVRGGNELLDYQFNKKVVHHLFCPTCGVGSFSRGEGPDGAQMVAINVRCLDDIDLDALTITKFDGASL